MPRLIRRQEHGPHGPGGCNPDFLSYLFRKRGKKMKMGHGWQFLSFRWWLAHCLGFSLVYAAGRLTALLFKG
jgi:hypothetical protein